MMEYRCTCRKCHTYYCFNDKQIKAYKLAKNSSKVSLFGSIASVADGDIAGTYTGMENGAKLSDLAHDLTRCPNCGSIDIAVERHELPFV